MLVMGPGTSEPDHLRTMKLIPEHEPDRTNTTRDFFSYVTARHLRDASSLGRVSFVVGSFPDFSVKIVCTVEHG